MQLQLRAYYCPCCGARLPIGSGQSRAECEYCQASLEVHRENIRGQRSAPRAEAFPEPPATLRQWAGSRFEMSLLAQTSDAGEPLEVFTAVDLSEERFAMVYLRVVDKDGRSLAVPLEGAFEALTASLQSYGDPGLAANQALETLTLCASGFPHRLEIVVALFEPRASCCTVYAAGCQQAIWWMSCEEGRSVTVDGRHPALEKKMLREQRDHFSHPDPVYLAGGDLLVIVSAAYCGRGGGPYDSGLNGLAEALNESLGEDPLRVVTLAKNAFWSKRVGAVRDKPPCGPLQVVAVQALPRPLLEVSVAPYLQQFGSELFEIAVLAQAGDWLELVPLHNQRAVLIWASNDGLELGAEVQELLRQRVVAVLDRPNHGDNENPRAAGRAALEGQKLSRLAVIQFFDEWGRVKYFRHGWKQPLTLGPRSVGDSACSLQAFDEGGEATVPVGARLFFPGNQNYPGQTSRVAEFAARWPGGKASRLYQALCEHWKTPPGGLCLSKLAGALVSDLAPHSGTAHLGMALVTRKRA